LGKVVERNTIPLDSECDAVWIYIGLQTGYVIEYNVNLPVVLLQPFDLTNLTFIDGIHQISPSFFYYGLISKESNTMITIGDNNTLIVLSLNSWAQITTVLKLPGTLFEIIPSVTYNLLYFAILGNECVGIYEFDVDAMQLTNRSISIRHNTTTNFEMIYVDNYPNTSFIVAMWVWDERNATMASLINVTSFEIIKNITFNDNNEVLIDMQASSSYVWITTGQINAFDTSIWRINANNFTESAIESIASPNGILYENIQVAATQGDNQKAFIYSTSEKLNQQIVTVLNEKTPHLTKLKTKLIG